MAKSFIAVLGAGKGTWGHVARLIADEDFENILMVTNEFGQENFKPDKPCDFVLINSRAGFDIMKDQIKEKIPEGELAVSIVSGSGKEHTALLAALRELKREFEFVILTGDGTKYY